MDFYTPENLENIAFRASDGEVTASATVAEEIVGILKDEGLEEAKAGLVRKGAAMGAYAVIRAEALIKSN